MARMFRLTRDVGPKECHWLDETIPKGTSLKEYTGYTYGCIGPTGIACCYPCDSDAPMPPEFTEIPHSALEPAP